MTQEAEKSLRPADELVSADSSWRYKWQFGSDNRALLHFSSIEKGGEFGLWPPSLALQVRENRPDDCAKEP
jgi:hypothetical protein